MPQDIVSAVLERNQFYRDNFRRMTSFVLFLMLVVLAEIGAAFYGFATRLPPSFFATTTSGENVQLIPLSQPNLNPDVLLNWATNAATAAFSLDFVNYQDSLKQIQLNFTPDGYQSFMDALDNSQTLQKLLSQKLVIQAIPTGSAVILNEGLINNNIYAWKIQLRMLRSLQSGNEIARENIVVTLLVTRLTTLESPQGVGIAQFIVDKTGDPTNAT